MQHVINFAFDFDDDRVKRIIENRVESELNSVVNDLILDQIAPFKRVYFGAPAERDFGHIKNMMSDRIDAFLESHRGEIIELAAKMLVKRIGSTKAWKEKVGDILD